MFSRISQQRWTAQGVPYLVALGIIAPPVVLVLIAPNDAFWPILKLFAVLVAIMASAWQGYGPGILAVLLTLFFVPYLTGRQLDPGKVNSYRALFVLISILISRVAVVRRRLENDLRLTNERLDQQVKERTAELERANEALRVRESLLVGQAEELSRSNTDLQQIAYFASHDLREPLRMIAMDTQRFGRRYQGVLDKDADQLIGTVTDGVRRMERLVDDLLGYARVMHAGSLITEPIHAKSAVDNAIANLRVVVEESRARIEIAELPYICCDSAQITQVFQNLLSNALKYRSDAPPVISITSEGGPSEWVFSVADNGIGIEPDHLSTIFEPFKRLHGRLYPGSGVGLAICQRVVERHGGRIWVISRPGNGSQFMFTIPVTGPAARLMPPGQSGNQRLSNVTNVGTPQSWMT